MTNAAKKGKLIVLAGAATGPDGKMIKTGLEPLLAELNVKLGDKFVYNWPNQLMPYVDVVVAGFSKSAEQNPILQAIVKVRPTLQFFYPREVEAMTTAPGLQATVLMLAIGTTWLE